MRQIMLDTETTGLEHRLGDRVIEIGCVEMVSRKLTGQRFHRYLNPEREVEAGALAVHGLSNEFLQDKPKFGEIADDFMEFVRGAQLVIHNAPFDIGFLNSELARAGLPLLEELTNGVVDTLKMAKELHPGRRNSLDALCERYQINNSQRTLHGALLDAELLADTYLAMTRGQDSLVMELDQPGAHDGAESVGAVRPTLVLVRADAQELSAHERVLDEIVKESKGRCLWRAAEAASG
ncbi:MAG: DNA polymerase III subunit epsilon [Rhodocyclaceae bacterium]